jgi:ABC-type transporter Mla subunit MlaD
MALQDLTPQLRTRLSRMERAVGLFVLLALALLIFGFGYYIYNTAKRKGWFLTKADYFIFVDTSAGLKVGDPVRLMGADAGEITEITPMGAEQFTYNIYIKFHLKWPHYEYMWTEGSRAKVTTADLLGKRILEVTKGTGGYPSYVSYPLRQVSLQDAQTNPEVAGWVLAQEVFDGTGTDKLTQPSWPLTNAARLISAGVKEVTLMDKRQTRSGLSGVWDHKKRKYIDVAGTNMFWLQTDESPALTERLDELVTQVQNALPNIFDLTNQLAQVLENGVGVTSNLNSVLTDMRPVLTNLARATAQLDKPGSLGTWLLPPDTLQGLNLTLTNANGTLTSVSTNIAELAEGLSKSLENLAKLTGNLSDQVKANPELVGSLTKAITDTDDLVQGLKHHWLLRSAFKTKKTNAPPAVVAPPRRK